MRIEQAFALVVELDAKGSAGNVQWRSINLWPLIRQCLWFELLGTSQPSGAPVATSGWRRMSALVRKIRRYVTSYRDFNVPSTSNAQLLFVSRPVYLQRLSSGRLFDRIVDPLIFARHDLAVCEKLYVSPWPDTESLHFQAHCLIPARAAFGEHFLPEDEQALQHLATQAGLDPARFLARCKSALNAFARWYAAGTRLLARRTTLKTIYLTSWYFPDMMGLTAAAHHRGIPVIDVQHGKQGRFQGMYSGWGNIPPSGYELMPDKFWCWGKPSCDHILSSSPAREVHRPFVGGFPWLDYYRQHVSTVGQVHGMASSSLKCILVTTQPPQSENTEPLPDFIVDYLRSTPEGVHFVIRCHPNDVGGAAYCKRRLTGIPEHLYSIDSGKDNLYDRLLQATHHVTAYSSCCYEASAFGVPTLLYGADGKALYEEEISAGEFSWTEGRVEDIAAWLAAGTPTAAKKAPRGNYIESSLALAGEILAQE